MFLVLFSACLLLCVLRYQKSPGLRWAVPAGVCAGLMYATKETAVLVFFAVAAACLAARFRFRLSRSRRHGAGCSSDRAVVALDAAVASRRSLVYAARAGSGGRSRASLVLLPPGAHSRGRHAVAAGWLAVRVWPGDNRMATFLGTYAAVLTVLYSALPYKTPWCAAGMVHGWILTAAVGLQRAAELALAPRAIAREPSWSAAAAQAVRYAFPLAADPRNPYAYAHTTRDVFEIRDRIRRSPRAACRVRHGNRHLHRRKLVAPALVSAPLLAGALVVRSAARRAASDRSSCALPRMRTPSPGCCMNFRRPVSGNSSSTCFPGRLAAPGRRSPRLRRGQRCAAELPR